MKDWINIIKEFSTFFGKKLDGISNSLDALVAKEMAFPEVQKVSLEGIKVVTIKGDKGETPTKEELLSLIKPLIPDPIPGNDGITPTKKELQALIKPLIPKPIPGKDGNDSKVPGPRGLPGKDGVGKPGKDGSPDTGEEIIQKINKDKSDSLISKDKVEGLADIESMARTADANARSFGNTGSYVYDYDFSSLLDGVTKTFTLPANAKVVLVSLSSIPVLRKTTDYTTTASSITFTSEINASTDLASGQSGILLYKIL